MQKFTTLISSCLPLRTENIDTDQIIPAVFLKTTVRIGIGKYFFYNWRYDESGKKKGSVFWYQKYKMAKILIAGNNFGCGSSREHAAWAILDYGFRAVISSSFGDIFYNNSLKNGLLPVIVSHKYLDHILKLVELEPETHVTIDLEKQALTVPSATISYHFPIDAFKKQCLLNGVDELGFILSQRDKIKNFEKQHHTFVQTL